MVKLTLRSLLPAAVVTLAAVPAASAAPPAINIFQLATRPLCGFISSFPQPLYTFNINAPEIWISVDIFNVTIGSAGTILWTDPNGNVAASDTAYFTQTSEWCWWAPLTTVSGNAQLDPSKLIPGSWTVQFQLNGTTLGTLAFTLTLPGGCTTISLGSSSAEVPGAGGACWARARNEQNTERNTIRTQRFMLG